MAHLRESAVPTLIAFLVPLVALVFVYGWSIIKTIYVDHQNLARENLSLRNPPGPDIGGWFGVATGPYGTRHDDTVVIITGMITNKGTPTVLYNWQMQLRFEDGRTINGTYLPPPRPSEFFEMHLAIPGPPLSLAGSDWWPSMAQPSLGLKGWLFQVFKGVTQREIADGHPIVRLSVSDINHKQWIIDEPITTVVKEVGDPKLMDQGPNQRLPK